MVNLSAFLSQVAAIASERPTYRLGGEGADGTCDCIGLIIGAIERAGGKWKGTHGSNYAARNEMAVLNRQIDATQMELGWAVYKAKAPNESGYALPDKYKSGSDLLDYYHVGVVTGIEPLEITHCTTGGGVDGIVTDSKQGKWLYGGPLALVDYGEEAMPLEMAIVRASSGGTVNLRKTPGGALVDRVPVGATVNVLERGGEWSKVAWNGKFGHMQTRFLDFGEGGADAEDIVVSLSADVASALMAALKRAGVS